MSSPFSVRELSKCGRERYKERERESSFIHPNKGERRRISSIIRTYRTSSNGINALIVNYVLRHRFILIQSVNHRNTHLHPHLLLHHFIRFGVRLHQRHRMLRKTQLLERAEIMAAIDYFIAIVNIRTLGLISVTFAHLRFLDQEVL